MITIKDSMDFLESLKEFQKSCGFSLYCVCSDRNSVVYVAKTFEEAELFIKNIDSTIKLNVVEIF